jgi:hypothetical protein
MYHAAWAKAREKETAEGLAPPPAEAEGEAVR